MKKYHDLFEYEELIKENEFINFLTALQIKIGSDKDLTCPNQDLKKVKKHLDLSGSHINDLSGIDLCSDLLSIDLSDNAITDISALGQLQSLEELYLPNNQITRIDGLMGLKSLKKIDLSMNPIENITPLFQMERLEFAALIDVSITKEEIKRLGKKGILVIT